MKIESLSQAYRALEDASSLVETVDSYSAKPLIDAALAYFREYHNDLAAEFDERSKSD